jgi:hypothetical protein
MTLTPTTRFRLRSDVRLRLLGDEAIVLVQEKAVVFGLNQVGARLIEMLREGRPVGELAGEIGREFDAAGADVAADVATFLGELVAIGAVEEVPAGEGAGSP